MVSDIWVGAGLQKNIHHDRRATIRQDVQRRLWKLIGGGLLESLYTALAGNRIKIYTAQAFTLPWQEAESWTQQQHPALSKISGVTCSTHSFIRSMNEKKGSFMDRRAKWWPTLQP